MACPFAAFSRPCISGIVRAKGHMHSPAVLIGLGAGVAVCLYALIFGHRRERLGGLIYLGGLAVAFALKACLPDVPALRYPITDILCLIGYFVLCWKSSNPWPLFAFGAQLLGVATEISYLQQPDMFRWAYFTVLSISGYGVLLSLAIGTYSSRRSGKHNSQK